LVRSISEVRRRSNEKRLRHDDRVHAVDTCIDGSAVRDVSGHDLDGGGADP
jgi:hypothetical protein